MGKQEEAQAERGVANIIQNEGGGSDIFNLGEEGKLVDILFRRREIGFELEGRGLRTYFNLRGGEGKF